MPPPIPNPDLSCQILDPRIRRTRQLVQDALWKLLKTKNFDDISVQDITETATVNRATFYDHYADKFALLECMVAGGFHRMLEERSVVYAGGGCPSAAKAVILAAADYLSTLREAQVGRGRRTNVEGLEDAAMIAAIRRVLERGMALDTSLPAARRSMQAAAVSWAIYGAVKEWIDAPEHPPAEAIVPEILEVIAPLLGGAASPARVPHPGES